MGKSNFSRLGQTDWCLDAMNLKLSPFFIFFALEKAFEHNCAYGQLSHTSCFPTFYKQGLRTFGVTKQKGHVPALDS